MTKHVAGTEQSLPSGEPSRLPIPGKSAVLGASMPYVLVGVFTALAIWHLFTAQTASCVTLLAAALWLGLVFIVICGTISDTRGGFRQFLVDRMNDFASQRYMEAVQPESGAAIIRFQFVAFGRTFTALEISTEAISTVDWSKGQASSIAGRDMDDWHVVLWYHDEGRRTPRVPGGRSEELHLIGPTGPFAEIEPFGRLVVEFLREAGVELSPTGKPHEFGRREHMES